MSLTIDHLVVTAATLERGIADLEALLGVSLSAGGEHRLMGTHNALLRLGDRLYLEVIAVRPGAPQPLRARWFGLDRSPETTRLVHWVARSSAFPADATRLGFAADERVRMQRDRYDWQLGVRGDGTMPGDGVLPSPIEWHGPHPAAALPDRGCRLRALAATHPCAAEIAATLQTLALDAEPPVTIRPGHDATLAAEIDTPAGLRRLGPLNA